MPKKLLFNTIADTILAFYLGANIKFRQVWTLTPLNARVIIILKGAERAKSDAHFRLSVIQEKKKKKKVNTAKFASTRMRILRSI